MSRFQHLNIAQEAIDFQSGSFFKELSLILKPYVGNPALDKPKLDHLAALLEKVIERHTGINVSVSYGIFATAVAMPDIDGGHPIASRYASVLQSTHGLNLINRAGGRASGQVDMAKSRVSGIFAETKIGLYIERAMISSGSFTPEEVAAVILHELGHYFVYCELLDQTISGNLLLIGLDQALRGGRPDQREIVIERAGKLAGFNREVVEDMKKSTSDVAVSTIFVTELNKEARSQSVDTFYDQTSWEMAADQFASRHGAGRHLVTALAKYDLGSGNGIAHSKFVYYMLQVFDVVRFILLALGALVMFNAMSIATIILGVLFSSLCYGMLRPSKSEYSESAKYDTPKDRAMRVRRQLVEKTKNLNLPKEVVRSLVHDIQIIDEVVKIYGDDQSLFEKIELFLFSSARRRADSVKLQKELEALAMNDLFVKSAELKHL